MKNFMRFNMEKTLVFSLFSFCTYAQEIVQDSTKTNSLAEVLLSSTRLKAKSPFTFSNSTKQELASINLGQDLPFLLDQMPSVVTTSDAGAGVGYTSMRVRGSDATRINVTINGIPYNDAESQGTYFVDIPDFITSVEDIQLQRGVGTSTNGSGAFGASLNLRTLEPSVVSYATLSNSFGSFGTIKHSLSLGSGIKKGLYAEGRLSKVESNGYIDRAFSDLKSFYAEMGFVNTKTTIKAIVFGGKEITYQSWYGTPEAVVNNDVAGINAFVARNYSSDAEASNLLQSGRTYNFYTYENQVDNYEQNHYQLHFSHRFNNAISASISGNFTPGKGYYEEYKVQDQFKKYFPNSLNGSDKGDVIRRKWATSDFYALVYSFNYQKDNLLFSVGGGYNKYDGSHFGEIIWSNFAVQLPYQTKYYESTSLKQDFNLYMKAEYQITKNIIAFADVQFRGVSFQSEGLLSSVTAIDVNKNYSFFNPKAGITYVANSNTNFYSSIAVGNREPNGDDITKNPTEPLAEQLIDYEFGYKHRNKNYFVNANVYFMNYNNQLVLTGELDDVGNGVRQNVSKSYRAGVEIEFGYQFWKQFRINTTMTFSKNKIKEFNYLIYDTQYDATTYDVVSYSAITTKYYNTDIAFSPNTVLGSSLQFSPTTNLTLSFVSKYVGKQFLDNTSSKSKSMPSYFVNSLNASFKLQPKWISEIIFNAMINNIFDKKYVSNGYTYSYFYRPQNSTDSAITENFYYPQAGINLLLGITLKL